MGLVRRARGREGRRHNIFDAGLNQRQRERQPHHVGTAHNNGNPADTLCHITEQHEQQRPNTSDDPAGRMQLALTPRDDWDEANGSGCLA